MSKLCLNNESKQIHKIYVEVDSCDFYKIRAYEEFIFRHMNNNDKIPTRVLKKFFSFFNRTVNPKYLDAEKQKEDTGILITKIKSETIDRFSNDSEYHFSEKTNNRCSFDCFLKNIFNYLSENLTKIWNNTDYNKRKDILIKEIYFKLNEYMDMCNPTTNKFYGKYKRGVITSYIVWKLGFHLSQKLTPKQLNGKQPTNQQLYESIKYHINKINKENLVAN